MSPVAALVAAVERVMAEPFPGEEWSWPWWQTIDTSEEACCHFCRVNQSGWDGSVPLFAHEPDCAAIALETALAAVKP